MADCRRQRLLLARRRLRALVGSADEAKQVVEGLVVDIFGVHAVERDPRDVLVLRHETVSLQRHLVFQLLTLLRLRASHHAGEVHLRLLRRALLRRTIDRTDAARLDAADEGERG